MCYHLVTTGKVVILSLIITNSLGHEDEMSEKSKQNRYNHCWKKKNKVVVIVQTLISGYYDQIFLLSLLSYHFWRPDAHCRQPAWPQQTQMEKGEKDTSA